jgi:hypothetical protein
MLVTALGKVRASALGRHGNLRLVRQMTDWLEHGAHC